MGYHVQLFAFSFNYVCGAGVRESCVCECSSPHGQLRAPDTLELQVLVVRLLMWVLGTEFRFFARTVHSLNYRAGFSGFDLRFKSSSLGQWDSSEYKFPDLAVFL